MWGGTKNDGSARCAKLAGVVNGKSSSTHASVSSRSWSDVATARRASTASLERSRSSSGDAVGAREKAGISGQDGRVQGPFEMGHFGTREGPTNARTHLPGGGRRRLRGGDGNH